MQNKINVHTSVQLPIDFLSEVIDKDLPKAVLLTKDSLPKSNSL